MRRTTYLLMPLALTLLVGALSARAETLPLPALGEDLVGTMRGVPASAEDTLLDIAYRNGFGYDEVKLANPGIDPWLPGAGTSITLPGQHILPDAARHGIVINIPEMRLYYYPQGAPCAPRSVLVFPIGIGKMGWRIPETTTWVAGKLTRPVWQVPDSIKSEHAEEGEILPEVVLPGPANPLGEYALQLGLPSYLIHGTNKKYGVGMRVSHGCIRLNPDDIRDLFKWVAVGTPVRIVNQPFKAGWLNGQLYLEAYPPLAELTRETGLTAMVAEVVRATRDRPYRVDWEAAVRVASKPTGMPQPIGHDRLKTGSDGR